LPRRLAPDEFIQVFSQGVGLPYFQSATPKRLNEGRHQGRIELESEHPLKSIEQRPGERTMSRTNFNDPGRFGSEYSCDPLGKRFIDQEVLTEATAFWPTHPAHPEF
jgi:hypothetical protein